MGNYWKLIGSDGEHTVHTPSVLCSNNGEVLREAAIKGLGIALLPIFIVGNYLKQGTLRPVLPDYHPREIYVCIVYPAHRHLSTKIQLFTHFLKARFGDRSDWAEE
jgi:DNA-binding transcriptional LysR family regulator